MIALPQFAPSAFRVSASAGAGGANEMPLGRRLVPLALVPLGAIYCQTHEIFFEDSRSTMWGSLAWASATLLPWVIATMIFEWRLSSADLRAAVLRRAALLAVAAYLFSGATAILLGASDERAFYSRLPLLAAAMLAAALYPLTQEDEHSPGIPANENAPPVALSEIVYASAAGNYVELHADRRTIIWRQTMQNAERILAPAGFVRVHRSYLVPLRAIEQVANSRKGPVAVALRDGPRLPVSTRYAPNLTGRAA